MSSESVTKTAIGFFLIILVGTLLAAILGGAFGALVAGISPEFVQKLFELEADSAWMRYAWVVGMLWGLFIGIGVTMFACFVAAIIKILRIRFEHKGARD